MTSPISSDQWGEEQSALPDSENSRTVVDEEGHRSVRPSEIHFFELAKHIPTFAGFHVESDELVIRPTGKADRTVHQRSMVNYVEAALDESTLRPLGARFPVYTSLLA